MTQDTKIIFLEK